MAKAEPSWWDREPIFVRWQVATWEHAALDPNSHGLAHRLRDTRRLLPEEITKPIYALLAEAEALIIRITEPVPPFDARLLRDVAAEPNPDAEGNDGRSTNIGARVDRFFSTRIGDLVPDWSAHVSKELGARGRKIKQHLRSLRGFGIPRNGFSIRYGYRICLSAIRGRRVDPRFTTHRSLLMSCHVNLLQPGEVRDLQELLLSCRQTPSDAVSGHGILPAE